MVCVGWLAVAGVALGRELSFQDALAQALQANEALLAARAEVEQKQESAAAMDGLLWPHLGVSGEVVEFDDPLVLDLDPIRSVILKLHPNVPAAAVPHFKETLLDQTVARANVHGSWTLFTGGKIDAARGAARAELATARASSAEVREHTTAEVVHRYYALRLARTAQAVRQEVLDGMQEHLRQARRLEEEGLIARAERLHAEVALAEADRQVKKAARDEELARIALSAVLSADTEELEASSPLFVLSSPPPVAELLGAAGEHNPVLQRIAAQEQLAKEGSKAARAKYFPDVFAFGMRQLREADLMPIEPRWAVGVGLKIDLFDGFERGHLLNASQARERRVAFVDSRARRDIATGIEKRYREMLSAREQLDALGASRALAEESLRVRTRAFEEGLGTSLDVVDARLALEKVRLERLLAAYDYVSALADVLETSGQAERFVELQARADVEVER
jgi:outer membrane protein TolC